MNKARRYAPHLFISAGDQSYWHPALFSLLANGTKNLIRSMVESILLDIDGCTLPLPACQIKPRASIKRLLILLAFNFHFFALTLTNYFDTSFNDRKI
ncbi:MAG: hypothetical protein HC912_06400 [Saprospiraceae bacterium]|nr:hypothetical protein [Saprospiraceae bacterium]